MPASIWKIVILYSTDKALGVDRNSVAFCHNFTPPQGSVVHSWVQTHSLLFNWVSSGAGYEMCVWIRNVGINCQTLKNFFFKVYSKCGEE